MHIVVDVAIAIVIMNLLLGAYLVFRGRDCEAVGADMHRRQRPS
jgi:hypothetical protein